MTEALSGSGVVRPRSDKGALLLTELRKREPECPDDHLRQLSALWADQVDAIVQRTLELSRAPGRLTWHTEAKEESVHELARLTLWLVDRLLQKRLIFLSRRIFRNQPARRTEGGWRLASLLAGYGGQVGLRPYLLLCQPQCAGRSRRTTRPAMGGIKIFG